MGIFRYFYKGTKTVFDFIINIFRYFFLGLKFFPTSLAHMLGGLEKNNKDNLLIESKKNGYVNEKKLEKERNKTSKKTNKQLSVYLNNSEKMLDKDNGKRNKLLKNIKEEDLVEIEIDFKGQDAVKSEQKQVYEYFVKDNDGHYKKGYFNAFSRAEVYSFLKSEGNTVYKIETNKWINLMHRGEFNKKYKYKNKQLIFLISMLSTYLKAGITLADAIKILSRQISNKHQKRILNEIVYDLSVGFNFSEAMERRNNAFPPILINMVKTAEMTGELPDTLDDMEEYFTEIEATRKAMVTAMMYPAIIFVIAIGVGTFIMLYVVPKFVDIYKTMDDAQIPLITTLVLGFSTFLQKYIIYIGLVFIIILLLLIYMYKNIKSFRVVLQNIFMRIPVFGSIIIYNEVTNFTKTFGSLLHHNVYITDSMDILNQITSNEIYKELIYNAIVNISKGKSISLAFKDHWAFPVPAYEMIVTGEKTGQLPEMMYKVSSYYQDLHKNSVTRVKTFIEPVLIVLLTTMVGVIVLSIVVPMFSMYSQIQS